ncbi:hypothetical protein H7F33_14140 [Pedobacter sp. PAMC26386]|nr:hypothetical protein H7F33_14140 [Pedobacter sp. PAMC26386]
MRLIILAITYLLIPLAITLVFNYFTISITWPTYVLTPILVCLYTLLVLEMENRFNILGDLGFSARYGLRMNLLIYNFLFFIPVCLLLQFVFLKFL